MSAELKHRGVAVAEERWRREGRGEEERGKGITWMRCQGESGEEGQGKDGGTIGGDGREKGRGGTGGVEDASVSNSCTPATPR